MKYLTVSITYKIKHICILEKKYLDLRFDKFAFVAAVGRHKEHKAVNIFL